MNALGITRLSGQGDAQLDIARLADMLAMAADANDLPGRRHSQTVSRLCEAVALELGLTDPRVAQLRLAGLLHDVGTIHIPSAVVHNPGRLNDEELELIRTHPRLGFAIVETIGLSAEADWILHHHERIDGYGYPDGLSDADITIEARIVFVADAFEAMTAAQPHRLTETDHGAIARLRRHAGTQFDPKCVAALETVLGRGFTRGDARQQSANGPPQAITGL